MIERKERQMLMARERYKLRRAQGLCIQCAAPNQGKLRCPTCHDADRVRVKLYSNKRYQYLKDEAFNAYGNQCNCCGLTDIRFLTIDHINNDGGKHRAEVGHSTTMLLVWLKKRNWPTNNFQLLCWNCNMAKARHGGICPHKTSLVANA